jgi:cytochrome P450
MLKLTAFFLLENPDMARKLKDELQSAIPDPSGSASWTQLTNLPYLNAIVHEGLRMSYGVCHRLQRIKPDGSLFFRDWVIPAGTPVSMTSVLMHNNPLIFPSPAEFRPERWLDQEGLRLEKYLVPFSRGTRSCIGSNLAYAEIYMTLATVFRRFDFELFETTRADVDMVHDFFNPCVRLDSKGIRAKVTSSALEGEEKGRELGRGAE